MSLIARIEKAITAATDSEAKIQGTKTAFGGCINDSRIISLDDGREYFLKTHADARQYPGIFKAEYQALLLLSESNSIRVPLPLCYEQDFIVMESFTEGVRSKNWYEQIGRQLALLHSNTKTDKFGFKGDNYLGTTVQINSWSDSWLEFWSNNRLEWQLELYRQKVPANDSLIKLGHQLLNKLDSIIGDIHEPAVLLHGDLWSGNAANDEQGQPIIFDPASYYGHREAEIGMMRMFGGFGPRVEAAYEEVWPLQADSNRRINLYRLYHELNHLNLFGQGYYSSCLSTIKQIL